MPASSTGRALAALALVLLAAPGATNERPLPNLQAFLAEVRPRLQTDAQRQYYYSFVETRRRITLDGAGRSASESLTIIESHPGFPGEARWDRVIVRDGMPVSDAELRAQDETRRRETNEYQRRLTRRTEADRAKQEREWDRQRRELADAIDDVFRVYEIVMLGREQIDGHDTILFSLTPRPDATPVSDDGQRFEHFRARVWMSESEYELARLEVEAIDDVNIGLGVLARIRNGTVVSLERRKLHDDVWLPVRMAYTLSARVLLLKEIRERVVSEFSVYRKATSGARPAVTRSSN